MAETETILEYKGWLDYDIINELLTRIKKKKEFISLSKRTGKRLYAVLVECLENIAKHSVKKSGHISVPPFVSVRKQAGKIIIIAGNPVTADKRNMLENGLELINRMDENDLLIKYDNKINSIPVPEKNGAGLGFMLMKLKSENKIEYRFNQIDSSILYFEIKILIKEQIMRKLIINQTAHSPKVLFDPEHNRYEISGESRPPDAAGFYAGILNWVDDYSHQLLKSGTEKDSVFFNLDFEYFNSSSAKFILDFCKKIADIRSKGKDVNVKWHYEDDDTDMLEVGREMSKMAKFPFEFVSKVKK